MKTLASVAFGALALSAAAVGLAEPAAARSNVGLYVSPFGIGITVDQNRNYCSDAWHRRNHWDYCSRFYGGGYYDNGYYDNGYNDNGSNGFYRGGYRLHHGGWNGRDDHDNGNDHRGGDDRRGDYQGEHHGR